MWRPTLLFLALTAALSSVFYVIVNVTQSQVPWIPMMMWMPGLAAILTCLVLKRPLTTLGLGRWSTKYAFIGYLIPIAYCLVASLATWLLGLGGFPNTENMDGFAQTAGIAALPTWAVIIVFVLTTGIGGMVSGAAYALGEELGWRGFLVPELYRHLPFIAVSVVSGIIWAAWHYAITGVVYGGFGLPVWYWLPQFTIVATAISFVLAWLRIRSASLWPAVFLHASHNLWMQSVFTPLTTDTGPTSWVAGDLGLAFLVVALIVAVITILKRRSLPSREEFEAANA